MKFVYYYSIFTKPYYHQGGVYVWKKTSALLLEKKQFFKEAVVEWRGFLSRYEKETENQTAKVLFDSSSEFIKNALLDKKAKEIISQEVSEWGEKERKVFSDFFKPSN